MPAKYRVLSLDLHDTLVWDTEALVHAQYEIRLRRLAEGLLRTDESPVPLAELRRTRAMLRAQWSREGRSPESVPLDAQVEMIRQRLGAHYNGTPGSVVQGYAEGGLKEHPCWLNPEAKVLIGSLNARGFPVIVVTNTSRSGLAWKSFLEDFGEVRLADVIASTDVGACKPDPRPTFRKVKVGNPRILPDPRHALNPAWSPRVSRTRRVTTTAP